MGRDRIRESGTIDHHPVRLVEHHAEELGSPGLGRDGRAELEVCVVEKVGNLRVGVPAQARMAVRRRRHGEGIYGLGKRYLDSGHSRFEWILLARMPDVQYAKSSAELATSQGSHQVAPVRKHEFRGNTPIDKDGGPPQC